MSHIASENQDHSNSKNPISNDLSYSPDFKESNGGGLPYY